MSEYAPVFVVGMNGSGTTMLADSVGRHPQLYMMWEESKVLPYYILNQTRFGDLSILGARRKLMLEIGRTKGFWRNNGKVPVVLADGELKSFGIAGVIDALYLHFAAREGKTRWGDKSPNNTYHITALSRVFPDAQFIHIIRDGRDAARSFHRRWKYDPLHTITRWKEVVSTGRLQGRSLGPRKYMEVRYEALTQNPEAEMRGVCDFLGLPFDSAVTQSGMHNFDPANPELTAGRIVPNSDKWRGSFSLRQVEAMERIAGRALSEFGYPVTTKGDHCPGSLRRKFWLVKDGFAYSLGFFLKYGIRALPRYLRHVWTARRQWAANRN